MAELVIRERQVDRITILDLSGDITISAGGRQLGGKIGDIAGEGRTKILLNLASVNYVDSCGLGNLIAAYNTVRREGGLLKLLHLTKRVREVMVITKLVTVFDVFEDERAALASYN